LYLNVEAVPGATEGAVNLEPLAAEARRLNDRREIDRGAVFRLKVQALERLWSARQEDEQFDRYCREMGESLEAFARYCALAERFGGDWQAWPTEYQRPDAPSVRRFAEAHAPRVRFHAWLQWLLDRQLAEAATRLPLVQDLPIGVDRGGADAWQWQDVLGEGVTVGAPPDQFNAAGQNWSLPPFIPHRLRATFYRPFIETLRASLRHAGGLRIDHVMGLFRLYWIPEGFSPQRGAYVRYPSDELLAIVALESHRAGAWVAGEDLGTVERQMRRRLAAAGMLSYKLLWFEDDPPTEYPSLSMAAISTHDLPTVAGLWTGADLAAQQRIGLSPSEANYREIRQRLTAASCLGEEASANEAVQKAYEALGRSRAAVLVANLEDALAVEERPNMPGTIDQWPNWRLALPVPIEDLESAALPAAIARALRRESTLGSVPQIV
jgi:4-alpha-glucanotransferase